MVSKPTSGPHGHGPIPAPHSMHLTMHSASFASRDRQRKGRAIVCRALHFPMNWFSHLQPKRLPTNVLILVGRVLSSGRCNCARRTMPLGWNRGETDQKHGDVDGREKHHVPGRFGILLLNMGFFADVTWRVTPLRRRRRRQMSSARGSRREHLSHPCSGRAWRHQATPVFAGSRS